MDITLALYPPLLFLGLGPWWLGLVWSLNILPAQSEALCTPTHTHTLSPQRCHTFPTAQCEITWSGSVFFLFFICIFLHLSTFVWKRRPSFSFAWLFCVLTFCNSQSDVCDTHRVFKSNGVDLTKTVKNVSGLCFSPKLYFAWGKLSLF